MNANNHMSFTPAECKKVKPETKQEWSLCTELPEGWIMTDDDSYQCLHYLDPIAGSTGTKYELYQVNKHTNCFKVAHSIIDLECYDQEDIIDALHTFGYNDMDDFVQQHSPQPIPMKADGHLDQESPFYIIEWQLIAEMLFEIDAMENEVPDSMFRSFKKACHYIFQQIAGEVGEEAKNITVSPVTEKINTMAQLAEDLASNNRFTDAARARGYVDGINWAIEHIFDVVAHSLPTLENALEGSVFFKSDALGEEILSADEAALNHLADVFEAMGIDVVTGYYDPEEDKRCGEVDALTGYYYLSV